MVPLIIRPLLVGLLLAAAAQADPDPTRHAMSVEIQKDGDTQLYAIEFEAMPVARMPGIDSICDLVS